MVEGHRKVSRLAASVGLMPGNVSSRSSARAQELSCQRRPRPVLFAHVHQLCCKQASRFSGRVSQKPTATVKRGFLAGQAQQSSEQVSRSNLEVRQPEGKSVQRQNSLPAGRPRHLLVLDT